jgi:hypothetical protein
LRSYFDLLMHGGQGIYLAGLSGMVWLSVASNLLIACGYAVV